MSGFQYCFRCHKCQGFGCREKKFDPYRPIDTEEIIKKIQKKNRFFHASSSSQDAPFIARLKRDIEDLDHVIERMKEEKAKKEQQIQEEKRHTDRREVKEDRRDVRSKRKNEQELRTTPAKMPNIDIVTIEDSSVDTEPEVEEEYTRSVRIVSWIEEVENEEREMENWKEQLLKDNAKKKQEEDEISEGILQLHVTESEKEDW